MKGYDIKEESYTSLGRRSMACTLILENGYEITGTHCIDLSDLIHEESMKQKAFHHAYESYEQLINAVKRQMIYGKVRIGRIGGENNEPKEATQSI